MALYLFVHSGPQKGAFFYLRDKSVIGRKKGADIVIEAPTVSGRHAQVEKFKKGLQLNSLSRRGILLKGRVFEKIKLKPNLIFSLGEVAFCVKDSIEGLSTDQSLFLITFNHLAKSKSIGQISQKQVFPFHSRLTLTITQGRQKGLEWPIGYGPRYIGTDSLDFPIYEPQIGPCGFYLEALGGDDQRGIVFFTKQKNIVRLNGKAIESQTLKTDDVVEIAATIIKVMIIPVK